MTFPTWQRELLEFLETARVPLLVIVGQTAGGKTALSLAVARVLREHDRHAEILNADSRQLYRGLDIGTAKISEAETDGVPHHLFSVLDPADEVTIAWYKDAAERIINDCHGRGSVPMLVGGSMLYVSAVIDGLVPSAPGNPALRAVLSTLYDQDAGAALHARLREIDPESANAIPRANKQYVIRALEIFGLTGKKKSESGAKEACPYDLFLLGVRVPKPELHRRIDERIESMFRDGWVEEVKGLLARGYDEHAPAMESHGYREIVRWIRDGEQPATLVALKEEIAKHTRRYAKRQMTWWKRDPRIRWIDPREA